MNTTERDPRDQNLQETGDMLLLEQMKSLYNVVTQEQDKWMEKVIVSGIPTIKRCECGQDRQLLIDTTVTTSQHEGRISPRYDICPTCFSFASYSLRRRNAGIPEDSGLPILKPKIEPDEPAAIWREGRPAWTSARNAWVNDPIEGLHWWLIFHADSRYANLADIETSQEMGLDFYLALIITPYLVIDITGAGCGKLAKLLDKRGDNPAAALTWIVGGDRETIEAANIIPEYYQRA